MSDLALPAGRYLTCPIDVAVDTGGQTRALLMRNRIFAEAAGIRPSVLTFGGANDLVRRREILLERGLLTEHVDLLNLYEHYRDTDWETCDNDPQGPPLADLSRWFVRQSSFPDGTPWRRLSRPPSATGDVFDYLRPDGTTYLRIAGFVFKDLDSWPTRIERVSRQGQVVGTWKSLSGFVRHWIRDLSVGHERSFVFIDSRHAGPLVAPMRAPSVHLVYLLHNIHVTGDRRWDSPSLPVYERLLSLVGGFDAFVTLTDRQRQDVAQARGRTSNLFVVPNPVDMPPVPESTTGRPGPPARDPRLVTVVARMEGQKRISHAIEAMRLVVQQIPDARMEIWGSGSRAGMLQESINRRGLQDSVTMKGHHPHARDALWTSSAMVMTSLFEGYPLSTLESLSHGCPVVSYDIKYGPREQITDGVDGFLVPPGDTELLASRIVTLLRDPALVARMSEAALETARRHGNERFVNDWAGVLESAVELKSRRTRIEDATLTVRTLEVATGGGLLGRRSRVSGPASALPDDRLVLVADLVVDGHSRGSDLGHARVELAAVHQASGAVIEVPASVERSGSRFTISADVPLGELYPSQDAVPEPGERTPGPAGDAELHLRLRLVWENSSWQTVVRRPAAVRTAQHEAALEVAYDADGALRVIRR